jgi:hypothetical protein
LPVDEARRADIVRVEVPELVTDAGVNDERVPGGNPVTVKRIVAMREPTGLTLIS